MKGETAVDDLVLAITEGSHDRSSLSFYYRDSLGDALFAGEICGFAHSHPDVERVFGSSRVGSFKAI